MSSHVTLCSVSGSVGLLRSASRVNRAGVSLLCFVAFAACSGCGSDKGERVFVRETRMPPRAFSMFGEATAWVAYGSPENSERVDLSLERLTNRIGSFERARVFEFDPKGNLLRESEAKLDSDETISIRAIGSHSYLVYADLGRRVNDTYRLLCRLSRRQLPTGLSSRVCTQILCAGVPMRASQLMQEVPELAKYVSAEEMGDEWIGGFRPAFPGAGGFDGRSICDDCLGGGGFYPVRDCEVPEIWPPRLNCGDRDDVVFDLFQIGASPSMARIGKMTSHGGDFALLTPANGVALFPDVDLNSQRIVFSGNFPASDGSSTSDTILVVNTDGTGMAPVPDVVSVLLPRWSNDPDDPCIVFAKGGRIFRVMPDGSALTQLTFPPQGHADSSPELGPHGLHFVRTIAETEQRDVFHLAPGSGNDPHNVTDSPGVRETSISMSHNGELLAITENSVGPVVFSGGSVVISRIQPTGALQTLHRFMLRDPLIGAHTCIAFSSDDSCLIVTTRERGGDAMKSSIFGVSLDGQSIEKLSETEINTFLVDTNRRQR